jgi:UDP-N-acetylmuramoylalanine--D-glutamate ligase
LACAVEVAKQFNISISKIKKTVSEFKDLEGRMQLLRVYKGIKIYNDNNATTPEATIAGLEALSDQPKALPMARHMQGLWQKNIILICGGDDKGLNLDNFIKVINKSCKFVSLIPGSGTDRLLSSKNLKVESYNGTDFKDVIIIAIKNAKKGDVVILSPAFASFGMFNNEYERNDLFIKIIKELK